MAIKLENKPNVDAPSASYNYGNIRDNPGNGTGTPLNALVHADFHQFFAKMLDAAEGTGFITANGLPENDDNGYQYYTSLQIAARIANKVLLSVLAESIIGNNLTAPLSTSVPYALMGLADSGTAIAYGYIYFNGTVYRCNGLTYTTVVDSLEFNVSGENILAITDTATPGLFNYGQLVFVQNYSNAVQNPNELRKKVIDIGAWNMNTTASVSISHGLSSITKIRSVSVFIRDDFDTTLRPIDWDSGTGAASGYKQAVTGSISIVRTAGLAFDSTSYQDVSGSPAYNRGFIVIEYVE